MSAYNYHIKYNHVDANGNHLGNVLSVVTDNINISPDSAFAKIVAATDYYAFGSEMPGRTYSSPLGGGEEGAYRYGFNGKEKDTENTWGDTSYDYGFRIYNPRYGRFLSVDPLTKSYPMLTPYQFASNMPIWAIDLDGLEAKIATIKEYVDENPASYNQQLSVEINRKLLAESIMNTYFLTKDPKTGKIIPDKMRIVDEIEPGLRASYLKNSLEASKMTQSLWKVIFDPKGAMDDAFTSNINNHFMISRLIINQNQQETQLYKHLAELAGLITYNAEVQINTYSFVATALTGTSILAKINLFFSADATLGSALKLQDSGGPNFNPEKDYRIGREIIVDITGVGSKSYDIAEFLIGSAGTLESSGKVIQAKGKDIVQALNSIINLNQNKMALDKIKTKQD